MITIIESLLDRCRRALAPRLPAMAAIDYLNITKSLVESAAADASCDTVALKQRGRARSRVICTMSMINRFRGAQTLKLLPASFQRL